MLFYNKGKIVAVCPACVLWEEGKKIYVSHAGSTYGGLVVNRMLLRIEKIKSLFEEFEEYLKNHNFQKCVLKMTMDLLCHYPQDVIKYYLGYCGYKEIKELNLYLDYSKFESDIMCNLSKMKKRNVKKCLDMGMELKVLEESQICCFHKILSKNLLKFGTEPVHSIDELIDLKKRMGSSIEFYGAYKDKKLLAGAMVFIFEQVQCAHTQYLAADPEYADINPMAFVYYKIAEQYSKRKFRYLSWGIVTEHGGSNVNWGLANNKEQFGSLHLMNSIFEKDI